MNCFSEFTYSVYADGELSPAEAHQVEAHLATCPACQARLNIMRNENIMISNVLAEARLEPESLPDLQPASPSGLIFAALGSLAGAILGLRALLMGVSEWELSQLGLLDPLSKALDWLNPSSWSARSELFFSTVFYLVQEGAAMLSVLTVIAAVVCCPHRG